MKLQIATWQPGKLRICLTGAAGSGKTMSALLMAYGITGNWSKIALIDTEQESGSLYSWLGRFNTIQINHSFNPKAFQEALELCEEAQMEAVVIDSLSAEWAGFDGILSQYCAHEGDSVQKWDYVMNQHMPFMEALLHCSLHVIATVKEVKGMTQAEPGYDHSFSTIIHLSPENEASLAKDRTGILKAYFPCVITPNSGAILNKWCLSDEHPFQNQQRA